MLTCLCTLVTTHLDHELLSITIWLRPTPFA